MFIMQYLSNIYCSIYQISIAVFIKYFSNIYQISCLSHDFLFLEREGGERSLEGPTTPFSRETNNNAFSSNIFQYFTTIQNDSQYFTYNIFQNVMIFHNVAFNAFIIPILIQLSNINNITLISDNFRIVQLLNFISNVL